MKIKTTVGGIEVCSEGFDDSNELKIVEPMQFLKLTGDNPYELALTSVLNRAPSSKPDSPGYWWYDDGGEMEIVKVIKLADSFLGSKHGELGAWTLDVYFKGTWYGKAV